MERARCLVFGTDRVATVVTDAESITRERELARLRLHRALGNDLVVDVQLHRAQRFLVRTGARTGELHAKRVLAWLQFNRRDELLLGLDAKEVVDVVELVVLDKQRMPAEARAVRKDHAAGIRVGDFDIGKYLV